MVKGFFAAPARVIGKAASRRRMRRVLPKGEAMKFFARKIQRKDAKGAKVREEDEFLRTGIR